MMSKSKNKSVFLISLDFEMRWGMYFHENTEFSTYYENFYGVRAAVDKILGCFSDYGVRATWAMVGFLFLKDFCDLKDNLPKSKPKYLDVNINPYSNLEILKKVPEKLIFAPDVIEKILGVEGNEIGSHTLSHYYCLEPGQTIENFAGDLDKCIELAGRSSINLKSFVFPRNQFTDEYLKVLRERGFTSVRGNENAWFYGESDNAGDTIFKRIFRLIDSYVDISGHNAFHFPGEGQDLPYNFPSSRFLRPYRPAWSFFDGFKLRRIKKSMTYAAQNGLVFHLWWHPHNFGRNLTKNINFLEKILDHFQALKSDYDMVSMNMSDLSQYLEH